jgi:hypothetical protein
MKNRKKMNIYHSLSSMLPLKDENVVVFVTTLVLYTNFTLILPIVEHNDYTKCKWI